MSPVIDPMPYVALLTTIDVLRFVAVFAIALFAWIAWSRTRSATFAFVAVGFTTIMAGIIFRYLAIHSFNTNALCLGCHGLEAFFTFYYLSIMLIVAGSSFVALAYVKRYDVLSIAVLAALIVIAVRLALSSPVAYPAVVSFVFGFIAFRVADSARRTRRATLTALGFGLLAVSFLFESLVTWARFLYPIGEILGLIGLILIALVLLKVWMK